MIQVFVTQKFAGRPRKGDRRGFGFVADDLKFAKAELGRRRATDIAIDPDSAPSFDRAEFWDREARRAALTSGKPVPEPLLVITA